MKIDIDAKIKSEEKDDNIFSNVPSNEYSDLKILLTHAKKEQVLKGCILNPN
jgi:hypothetical protein